MNPAGRLRVKPVLPEHMNPAAAKVEMHLRSSQSVLADCISSALLNKLIINGATGQTACQTTATSRLSVSTCSICSPVQSGTKSQREQLERRSRQ